MGFPQLRDASFYIHTTPRVVPKPATLCFTPGMFTDSSTDEYRMLIAENLKSLRARRGLTQAQLAEAAHIDPKTYQRYEYADINIPMSKAIRMVATLGCSLDELTAPPGVRARPIEEDLQDVQASVSLPRPARGLGRWLKQFQARRRKAPVPGGKPVSPSNHSH